ncbi:hypothetical protein [Ralstonia pseudosolanacearum]|uniref:hypothetical protein n=1 Tax=Ralstonia pseudosolanacearum TaxID=1310165 RepID=UPI001FF7AD2E|nr:hypothetical protein [Ralstonia pseudosolanacearum]
MDCSTVAGLAAALNRSPEALLEQLREAGLSHTAPEDPIDGTDKSALLAYFTRQHRKVDDTHGTSMASPRIVQLIVRGTRSAPYLRHVAESQRAAAPSATGHPPLFVSRHEFRVIARSGALATLDPAEPNQSPYLARMYALLVEGRDLVISARAQHVRRAFRDFLRKVLATPIHTARREMLASLADTTVAEDRLSCLLAERNACVHPAFAPPRVVA